MARQPLDPPAIPKRFDSIGEVDRGVARMGRRLADLEALDVVKATRLDNGELPVLESDIREAIRETFGENSPEFRMDVRRSSRLMFNIASLSHTLMADFLAAGGKVQPREFHAPADLTQLKEKVVINCPGYGARALWRDETVVPVRGQLAWLIPQRDVDYAMTYGDINVLPRNQGICVQDTGGGDIRGHGEDNETPDRAEAEAAVKALAELFGKRPGSRPHGQGR